MAQLDASDGAASGKEPIRLIIADDTEDIRMLLRISLSIGGNFEICGEAADGAEAVALADQLKPDAILLDLAMPVMDGLQAAPEITRRSPGTKIVMLSGFSKDRLQAAAAEAGAAAYIEKGAKPQQIAEVLLDVCGRTGGDPPSGVDDESAAPPSSSARVYEFPERSPPSRGNVGDVEVLRRTVAEVVGKALDLTSAFGSFADVVKTAIAFDFAGFSVHETDGSYRVVASSGGEVDRFPTGTVLPVEGRAVEALELQTPFTMVDTESDQEPGTDRMLADRGVRSYIAVPVLVAGDVHAVVGLGSTHPDAYTPNDQAVLEVLAREAAAALHVLLILDGERRAAEELQELSEQQIEWNRIVRHDLRSPLTVIGGIAETLRGAWDAFPDDKRLEMFDMIVRNVADMTGMLAGLEEVDSLESQSVVEVAPFDLGGLVSETVAELGSTGGRPCIASVPDGPVKALGEESKQRRILTNLIENAFKFSPAEEAVEVSVVRENGSFDVSVRDHGAGISSDDVPKLFKKFSRLRQPNGNHVRGTGLGLFICKSLVESQGGRIWVSSDPGDGSTFSYTVPAAEATAD